MQLASKKGANTLHAKEKTMTHHDPRRRIFLGRALVFGGTIFIPGILSAHEQHAKTQPVGVEDEDKPVKDPPPSQASNKITKAQAQYQEQPNGEEKCANCAHFLAVSNTCNLVDGAIAAEGWCKLWVTSG
jgi:hypothetical protein